VRAVHSSKAVGEPPFHLGASVFFALKDAVYAARRDAGVWGGQWVSVLLSLMRGREGNTQCLNLTV